MPSGNWVQAQQTWASQPCHGLGRLRLAEKPGREGDSARRAPEPRPAQPRREAVAGRGVQARLANSRAWTGRSPRSPQASRHPAARRGAPWTCKKRTARRSAASVRARRRATPAAAASLAQRQSCSPWPANGRPTGRLACWLQTLWTPDAAATPLRGPLHVADCSMCTALHCTSIAATPARGAKQHRRY